ncbi:MAG: retroviral-like aspartic protease family protein [Candidatus Fibromonas sp.]|jgi:hypothetical protein|nr:retroviral-like aspartic protease family protein [Candidatus Fibromonas sp.]
MGSFHSQPFSLNITPALSSDAQVGVVVSPLQLLMSGLNLQVAISTASADLQNPGFDKNSISAEVVIAHFDTGASRTSIDIKLAKKLKLMPTGPSTVYTANGPVKMPAYAIDLHFPNTNLMPFINLPIGSCNLAGQKNFSILLGRDVMSRWNVVWNGPSSTVFIND